MNCLVTRRYNLSLLHKISVDCVGGVPAVHGHDFKLEVTCRAGMNLPTGEAISRDLLDRTVREHILVPYDKTLVNEQVVFGTGEDLALTFLERLKRTILGNQIVAVQLTETRKNRYQGLAENSAVNT